MNAFAYCHPASEFAGFIYIWSGRKFKICTFRTKLSTPFLLIKVEWWVFVSSLEIHRITLNMKFLTFSSAATIMSPFQGVIWRSEKKNFTLKLEISDFIYLMKIEWWVFVFCLGIHRITQDMKFLNLSSAAYCLSSRE